MQQELLAACYQFAVEVKMLPVKTTKQPLFTDASELLERTRLPGHKVSKISHRTLQHYLEQKYLSENNRPIDAGQMTVAIRAFCTLYQFVPYAVRCQQDQKILYLSKKRTPKKVLQ